MKKLIAFVLTALMLFSLAACTENTKDPTKGTETTKSPEQKTATPAEVEAAVAAALGEGYLCTVDIPGEEMIMSSMADLDMTKIDRPFISRKYIV